MTPGTEKRCFVALPLDEALRGDLVEATMVLRQVDGLRVVPPENWHITLKFLGGVFDSQIEDVLIGNLIPYQ
jgi:2'-5' RNA ligase